MTIQIKLFLIREDYFASQVVIIHVFLRKHNPSVFMINT
jgi:hypothetical protein